MTRTLLRAGALSCALMTSTAMCTQPALAQSAPPPRFTQVDANGVDLATGQFFFSLTEGTIGAGEGALALERIHAGARGQTDNWTGTLYRRSLGGVPHMIAEFGGYSDTFTISGSTYTSTKANGDTLTDLGNNSFRYVAADGTRIDYESRYGGVVEAPYRGPHCALADVWTCAIPTAIVKPNGMTYTLGWEVSEHCQQYIGGECNLSHAYPRLATVTSSANYRLALSYLFSSGGSGTAPFAQWLQRTGAAFTNLAGAPASPPTISYGSSGGYATITDPGGRVWQIAGAQPTAIRRPGASGDTTSVSYAGGRVSAVTRDGVTTNYAWSTSGSTLTATVTDALGEHTIVTSDTGSGRVTAVTDPLGRTTAFQYDGSGRLTRQTADEGNYVAFTLDARGNVTEARAVAKAGSGLADLVTSATFPTSCSSQVTCNLPTSITDARGKVTDYSYDSTHGGITSVTLPDPDPADADTDRPQTRYAYGQVTAVTGQPVTLLGEISACADGVAAGCVGTANESRTVIAHDSANLRVASVTARSGNSSGTGSLSAVTAMGYDPVGNLTSVDGPLAGTADTTTFRYNAARQQVGAISPDPDGSGSLTHRATRTTYNSSSGLPTKVEQGTVAGTSDTAWAGFSASRASEVEYDGNLRPVVRRLTSGSTTYALIQAGYDTLGRPRCVAQRMNTAEFATASLPSDACTLDTEGTFGPDRIVRTSYDDAGQVVRQESGVGTSVAADEAIATYRDNGQVETLTDGEGNKTTYVYDGHDRLSQTQFPSPTTDGVSNSSDYEQLGYDANGNVTSRRLRDGNSIAFTYDALDWPTVKNLPGSEPDVSYTYDLLGRLTGASTPAQTFSFTFDALGRQLTETGPQGTVTSAYDIAGRRTSLSYPDGFVATYSHLVTGDMSTIGQSGVGTLITFGYDSLGRRTSLARANGAGTSYGYDAVSRLSSLSHDLSGTNRDLTLGYSYNPASQIIGLTGRTMPTARRWPTPM